MAAEVKQPFDLIRFALGERVTLKFRGDKTITGKLNVCEFFRLFPLKFFYFVLLRVMTHI